MSDFCWSLNKKRMIKKKGNLSVKEINLNRDIKQEIYWGVNAEQTAAILPICIDSLSISDFFNKRIKIHPDRQSCFRKILDSVHLFAAFPGDGTQEMWRY